MRGILLRKSNYSGRERQASIILLVLLGLLWSAGGTVLGAELKAVEVVSRVQAWLDGTHTLVGEFEQVLISSALGAGLEESGRLYIERPGKMRWDYTSPERKVAIIQGDLTWFYIEEDEQMFLGRLDGEIELLPMLLAEQTALDDMFSISLSATPRRGGEGAYRLLLEPLTSSSGALEQITLSVSPPGFAINSAEILDSGGNRSLYRFDRLERNGAFPKAIFHFEPPSGTLISGTH
jgi:outer membrane lipoprotein carrier protein